MKKQRCEHGCSCFCLISQHSRAMWVFLHSLRRVFSWSTSFHRCSSSSRWSFELKLKKHGKKQFLLDNEGASSLSWTHVQFSPQLWREHTSPAGCQTWPGLYDCQLLSSTAPFFAPLLDFVLFSCPPSASSLAPLGDCEPFLKDKSNLYQEQWMFS